MLQVSRQLWRPLAHTHFAHKLLLPICSSTLLPVPRHSIVSGSFFSAFTLSWPQGGVAVISWSIREGHTGTAGKNYGRRKKSIRTGSLQYAKRGSEVEAREDESSLQEEEERDSKGQSKRKALRAREWGVQLSTLSPTQLRQAIRWASLSDEVYDAVMLVKSLGVKVRNGKRRQYSYIGGLLREADPGLMEQVLKACIDGDPPDVPFGTSYAPATSADDLSDEDTTGIQLNVVYDMRTSAMQELDQLEYMMKVVGGANQEHLAEETTAHQWLEGLLAGDDGVSSEVFSNHDDLYFDRKELHRLMREVQQVREAVVSLQDGGSLGGEETISNPSRAVSNSAEKSETALFNFLCDLARRRLQDIQSLDV